MEQSGQPWAERMKELLIEIKKAVDLAKQSNLANLEACVQVAYRAKYEAILISGHAANPPPEPTGKRGRVFQGPSRNLLLRLDRYRDAVLAFMYDFEIPFDNNLAERDLRMMKVKAKISGCFRSKAGAELFCRIRGYISTIRKQGIPVLNALQRAFQNKPITPDLRC